MTAAAVTACNLQKAFGPRLVLERISFEIASGETVAFLGRNGVGKTTLFRLLLGLLKPDGGSVSIAGYDPGVDAVSVRRRVGYLASDQVMYGWMTPYELCRFLQPFYPTWDMPLAEDFLERFEIPLRTPIKELSHEQSLKLGLAAALAHHPEVTVFDDPAFGLDPIARREFHRALIELVQAVGTTVIYSSQQPDEVEAVADRVAILHGGQIVREGSIDDLRRDVRQVALPQSAAGDVASPVGLLDLRFVGNRLIATTDGAEAFLRQLKKRRIDHDVYDLSLEEIFEAFVTGYSAGWPTRRNGVAAL
jgi:ABC-2 type transport system ATP-binding protein